MRTFIILFLMLLTTACTRYDHFSNEIFDKFSNNDEDESKKQMSMDDLYLHEKYYHTKLNFNRNHSNFKSNLTIATGDTCSINDKEYAANTINPINPCQKCNPATSTTAWTNLPNNTSCGANDYVCQNGLCKQSFCNGEWHTENLGYSAPTRILGSEPVDSFTRQIRISVDDKIYITHSWWENILVDDHYEDRFQSFASRISNKGFWSLPQNPIDVGGTNPTLRYSAGGILNMLYYRGGYLVHGTRKHGDTWQTAWGDATHQNWQNNFRWLSKTISDADTKIQQRPSFFFDNNNALHGVYTNAEHRTTYIYCKDWSTSSCTTKVIEDGLTGASFGDARSAGSMAIDRNQNIHIVYRKVISQSNQDLMYIKKSAAGEWSSSKKITTIAASPNLIEKIEIKSDQVDNLFVGYLLGQNLYLAARVTNQTSWQISPAPIHNGVDTFAMGVDAYKRLNLVFLDIDGGGNKIYQVKNSVSTGPTYFEKQLISQFYSMQSPGQISINTLDLQVVAGRLVFSLTMGNSAYLGIKEILSTEHADIELIDDLADGTFANASIAINKVGNLDLIYFNQKNEMFAARKANLKSRIVKDDNAILLHASAVPTNLGEIEFVTDIFYDPKENLFKKIVLAKSDDIKKFYLISTSGSATFSKEIVTVPAEILIDRDDVKAILDHNQKLHLFFGKPISKNSYQWEYFHYQEDINKNWIGESFWRNNTTGKVHFEQPFLTDDKRISLRINYVSYDSVINVRRSDMVFLFGSESPKLQKNVLINSDTQNSIFKTAITQFGEVLYLLMPFSVSKLYVGLQLGPVPQSETEIVINTNFDQNYFNSTYDITTNNGFREAAYTSSDHKVLITTALGLWPQTLIVDKINAKNIDIKNVNFFDTPKMRHIFYSKGGEKHAWRCGIPKYEETPDGPTNGVCASAPTSCGTPINLCKYGEESAISKNGNNKTYNWTCAGINGGQNVNCSSQFSCPRKYSLYVGTWTNGWQNGTDRETPSAWTFSSYERTFEDVFVLKTKCTNNFIKYANAGINIDRNNECCPDGQVSINGNCVSKVGANQYCYATPQCNDGLNCDNSISKCVPNTYGSTPAGGTETIPPSSFPVNNCSISDYYNYLTCHL